MADAAAPAAPTQSSEVSDITAQAEALVEQSRALNERLTTQLSDDAPAAIAIPPPAAPAAAAPAPTPAPAKPVQKYTPVTEVAAPVQKGGGIFGIEYPDCARIIACLIVLYLFLAGFYAGLMTTAVHIRGGGQYKTLPSEFYGPFNRDAYFPGYGSRRKDREVLYPWVQARCNGITDETDFVCDTTCSIPTLPHHRTPQDNLICKFMTCGTVGTKCVNP